MAELWYHQKNSHWGIVRSRDTWSRNIHEGELQKLSGAVAVATVAVTGQAIKSAGFALALDKISAEDRDFVNPVC